MIVIPILAGLAAFFAYREGTKSSRASREIAQLNDRAAEILGSLVAPPTSLDDYNVTVLSTTHQQQVNAWLKKHSKKSRRRN